MELWKSQNEPARCRKMWRPACSWVFSNSSCWRRALPVFPTHGTFKARLGLWGSHQQSLGVIPYMILYAPQARLINLSWWDFCEYVLPTTMTNGSCLLLDRFGHGWSNCWCKTQHLLRECHRREHKAVRKACSVKRRFKIWSYTQLYLYDMICA